VAVTGGPAKGEDRAGVVKRVQPDSAHADSRMVRHTYGYCSGHVNADGSLVHSGPMTEEGYLYIAPDGTRYTRGWRYNRDGSPTGITGHGVMGPVVNGKQHQATTIINHASRTYSQQHTEHSVTGGADAPWYQALDLWSSPSEVQQALQSGQATQKGTTAVHGTPAIALSITVPHARNLHRTLYADALTCQPLRTVTVADGNPRPYIADWMPATPDNIAKAKDDDPIPAGYTKAEAC
jgi:hypothetical protein